jgi:hypothetical protein
MKLTQIAPNLHRLLPALLAFLALMLITCKKETSNLALEKETPVVQKTTTVKGSREFTEIYDMIERENFVDAFDKLAVYDGHVDYGTHLAALRKLVDRWLHANPQEALIAFQRIEPEHLRSVLLNMHMDIAVRHHRETYKLAQSIDDLMTRNGLQYRVLGELNRKDPEMALSFVTENFAQGSNRSDMFGVLFASWYKNSPETVIHHYQSFKYAADKLAVEDGIMNGTAHFSQKELERFQEIGFSEKTLKKIEALIPKENHESP